MDKEFDVDSELMASAKLLANASSNINKIKCTSCGHFNLSNNKKCLYCGKAVSRPEKGCCPACNFSAESDFDVCPICGEIISKFIEKQVDRNQRESERQQQEKPIKYQENLSWEISWKMRIAGLVKMVFGLGGSCIMWYSGKMYIFVGLVVFALVGVAEIATGIPITDIKLFPTTGRIGKTEKARKAKKADL